jgi:serine/threonine-protein kinase HipA
MLGWVVFNHLLVNCDAHAKNLSMLISRTEYRLAPLYDLLSTRIYPGLSAKSAMRLGREYRPDRLFRRHWERLADEAGVGVKAVLGVCAEMGESVPDEARRLAAEFPAGEAGRAALARIVEAVAGAAGRMLKGIRT